ncbi:ATP-dependent RNA helicase RhlB [Striga asiatica]|uniref:ATP-dependent RNA helicase RhlB n=1 Tax=Striga asiatica TaxID=4170 RepID=A0A5A7P4Z2_STRAF|nr:ATP-dependent RNA helicase RhlB [Striga asiatica]
MEIGTLGCVLRPYSSSMHISSRLMPSVNLKSNPCSKLANVVRTILSPSLYPGHLLLPDPNGKSAKSPPNKSTSLPKNLSGENSSGAAQACGSRPMLHILSTINHIAKKPVELPIQSLHPLHVPLKIKKIEPRHPIANIKHPAKEKPLVKQSLQLIQRHNRWLVKIAEDHAAYGQECVAHQVIPEHDGLSRQRK